MTIRNILFVLPLILAHTNVQGTIAKNVNYLGIEHGLSNNYITEIFQDRTGFMWFGTFDGLNRYDGYQFKIYMNQPGTETSLPDNRITAIAEDADGRIWVATKVGAAVLDYDDRTFHRLRLATKDGGSIPIDFAINDLKRHKNGSLFAAGEKCGLLILAMSTTSDPIGTPIPLIADDAVSFTYHVRGIDFDAQNRLWLVVDDVGLCYYDEGNRVVRMKNNHVQSAWCIQSTPDGAIWMGTGQGLFRYDPVTDRCTHYTERTGLSSNRVGSLHAGKNNKLWICTDGGGITIMDTKRKSFEYLSGHDDGGPLTSKAVFAAYEDLHARVWIGTLRGGINIIEAQKQNFALIRHRTAEGKTSAKNFTLSFTEAKDGTLWIGTDGAGLMHWDRKANRFEFFDQQPHIVGSLTSNFITAILSDKNGHLWVGTYGGGIARRDPKRKRFVPYVCFDAQTQSDYRNVWQLLEDTKGQIWATTLGGGRVFVFNEHQDRFEPLRVGVTDALTIMEEHPDTFWFGNFAELIRVVLSTGTMTRYPIGNPVRCIVKDSSNHRFWIGTEGGGLLDFNPATGKFKRYTKADGLPSNVVLKMLPDGNGHYWLSTYNGLSKFSPTDGWFQNFYESDGLQSNQFSYNAAIKLRSGELVFGGIRGFNIFHPDSLHTERSAPRIVLTDIRIDGNHFGDYSASRAPTGAAAADKLLLPYDEASISVGFAALEYSFPEKIQYAFFLEGWDKDWNHVGDQRNAHYSSLREGNYLLRIKSTDANGMWTGAERVLAINVLPPWWRSYWAYGSYLLLALSVIYAYVAYERRQTKLAYQVKLARMEITKERELNERKLAFFTHIAHEFRTPLSLIVNPVKDMLHSHTKNTDTAELTSVYRNAKRLLSLVDKLLLFQRAEVHDEDLRLVKLDIKLLAYEVFLCFKQHAACRSLDYRFRCDADQLPIIGDREKLEICLFNLINNAIKFTPEHGQVAVEIEEHEHHIEIVVSDTGCGVPEHIGDNLFERFYRDHLGNQHASGFGIGLFLVKKFADAHRGTITYVSGLGIGSQFKLLLLKGKAHFQGQLLFEDLGEHSLFLDELVADSIEAMPMSDISAPHTVNQTMPRSDRKRTMLVVDDNLQIRDYIANIFNKDFAVYTLENGYQALEFVKKHEPDMVISDVVMEGLSGIDLCASIKQDTALSHIPVILLTASTSKDVHLKGIEGGADDYITKPFDTKLLVARVANILHSRNQLQAYFYNEITLQNNPHNVSKEYSDFLQRCIDIVENQLDNPRFTVKTLADNIGMSHSTMYKRIKSISGKSANEFIRFIRLRKVAKMLAESDCTINEAAFAAGFNDIKYFREQFNKLFGMKPSEYKRKSSKPKKEITFQTSTPNGIMDT